MLEIPEVSEQQKLIEEFLLGIVEASAPPDRQQQQLSNACDYVGLTDGIDPEVAQRLIRGLIEGGLVAREPVLTVALIRQVVAKSGVELIEVQKRTLVEAQLSGTSQLDVARQLDILGSTFQTLLIRAANEGDVSAFFDLADPIPPDVRRLGYGEPDDGLKLQLLFNYAEEQLVAGRDNYIVATAQRLGVLEEARDELVALAVKHGRSSLYTKLKLSPAHCSVSELAQLMKNADKYAALAYGDPEGEGTDSR